VLLDRCIEIDAWEIVPGAGGGCDLRMALRSQTPAVIELRPGYRHWYGSQSVHRLPGSGVVRLRRPLDLVRPSADSGPLARPETPCDAFDFRAFRFTFRCGNLATVIYRSPGDPTADHMQANAARAVRPLPTSVNEAGGG